MRASQTNLRQALLQGAGPPQALDHLYSSHCRPSPTPPDHPDCLITVADADTNDGHPSTPPDYPSTPDKPPRPPRWLRRQWLRHWRRQWHQWHLLSRGPPSGSTSTTPPSPSGSTSTTPPSPSSGSTTPWSDPLVILSAVIVLLTAALLTAVTALVPRLAAIIVRLIVRLATHLLAPMGTVVVLPRCARRPPVLRRSLRPTGVVGRRFLRGHKPPPPRWLRLRLCGDIHPNPGPPRTVRGGRGRGRGRGTDAPPSPAAGAAAGVPPPAPAAAAAAAAAAGVPPPAPAAAAAAGVPPPADIRSRLIGSGQLRSSAVKLCLRVTGAGSIAFEGHTIRLGSNFRTPALPMVLHTDAVGAWSLLPLPPPLPTVPSDRILWLTSKDGRPVLVSSVRSSIAESAKWMWRDEQFLQTAHRLADGVRHIWFPSGDDDELSSDDSSAASTVSDSSESDSSESSDSTWLPSDLSSDTEEEEEPDPDGPAADRGPQVVADMPAQLSAWVAAPMHWRTFAVSRGIPRKRWERLYRQWVAAVFSDPIVFPAGKRCPPVCLRVRSTAFALRLVQLRAERMAAAAVRRAEAGPPLRRRRIQRVRADIQRGPVGMAVSLEPHPAPRVRGPVYSLYIDTCGGRIAGKRVTTAALRRCPPPPPLTSGQTGSLAVVAVWIGSLRKPAPQRFAQALPGLPEGTVHHHDLAAFWQFTNADSGSSCCALDTSRAHSYWTKQPCSCAFTLRDMHSLLRQPSADPIPDRELTTVGSGAPIKYVYPRGHSIKNAIASIWGTLCIIVSRYDDDLASRLERVLPVGDGFNPNKRGMTAAEIRELKSRRPPIGCRMREVKELIRRPDEWFNELFEGVRNDNIVRVNGVQWTVLHLMRTVINLARSLLDPRPDMPFARLRHLGSISFFVYKHWLASAFPYEVKFNGENKDQFESLTARERSDLKASIRFNSAVVLAGVPVHWFLEHGFDVFFEYEYPTAVSLILEEAEENSFLELAEKVPRMVLRRVQNIPYATEVGQKVLLVGAFGFEGGAERNRRYWSPTDLCEDPK